MPRGAAENGFDGDDVAQAGPMNEASPACDWSHESGQARSPSEVAAALIDRLGVELTCRAAPIFVALGGLSASR